MPKKVTIHSLKKMKSKGERIVMLTAYDATFSKLLDESSVDVLLVGDSLGMVIQGHDTTLPVTLDEIIYHTKAVVRGAQRAHVVGDMPFMTYQSDVHKALESAGRLVKEGGAHSVKIEGGTERVLLVQKLVEAGIPVMGHIGLTPQSFHQMGGFKVQGRKDDAAETLIQDALAIQKAGAYALVLEGIPQSLAARITAKLEIPTIGIGAGPDCDGQVLVIYDLLGMNEEFRPKFVRRYEHMATRIRTAVDAYRTDVKDGTFPNEFESFQRDPKSSPQRPNASVSALAHIGGCIPDQEKNNLKESTDANEEDTPLYSSIKFET